MVQDVPIEDISSNRRNPVLADVMAQLDYMEKRGSGLKKICNATRELESYKEERKPQFKSSPAQFMTVIYSMEYELGTRKDTSEGTSRGQVRGHVARLLGVMKEELSVREMMDRMEFKSRDKFLANYLAPALEAGLVEMTQPDSPKSPTQKYRLTEAGRKMLENPQ